MNEWMNECLLLHGSVPLSLPASVPQMANRFHLHSLPWIIHSVSLELCLKKDHQVMPGFSRKNTTMDQQSLAELLEWWEITHVMNLCSCCLLLYPLLSFVCRPVYWSYSSAEPSRPHCSHRDSGQGMVKIIKNQKPYQINFLVNSWSRNVLGSLILTSLINQSDPLTPEPSWIHAGSFPGLPRLTDKGNCSRTLTPPANSPFLYKLQGINRFLWIPSPAQISFPETETFFDFQLNSSLLNTNSISWSQAENSRYI